MTDKIKCPWCERQFKTQQGIKDHAVVKHNKQWSYIHSHRYENDLDRFEADMEWVNRQTTIEEEQSFGV